MRLVDTGECAMYTSLNLNVVIYLLSLLKVMDDFIHTEKCMKPIKCGLLDSYKENPSTTTIQNGDYSVTTTLEAPSHGFFSHPPEVVTVRKHNPHLGGGG